MDTVLGFINLDPLINYDFTIDLINGNQYLISDSLYNMNALNNILITSDCVTNQTNDFNSNNLLVYF
jgi:hypothetical protein